MIVFRHGRFGLRAVVCLGVAYLGAANLGGTGVLNARAEDAAPPGEFSCAFSAGTSNSFEAGAFKSQPAAPLAFRLAKIDLEGQSAQLMTGDAAKPVSVRIIRAINANHFLEVVNEGFLNLTTVYDKEAGSAVYPAVHSRHFGLVGQPVFAQYTGTCTAK
jgi:hypothetical protein